MFHATASAVLDREMRDLVRMVETQWAMRGRAVPGAARHVLGVYNGTSAVGTKRTCLCAQSARHSHPSLSIGGVPRLERSALWSEP
jgi:hypothetical protein